MLQLDPNSSLYKELQSDDDFTAYFLFEVEFGDADIAKDYLTTKPGNITIGDITYLPFRIPFSVDPPKPTSAAVDQALFTLALAPRDEAEMEVEKDKWEGRAYPQVFDVSNPRLPGITLTVKMVFETGETSTTRPGVAWFRDTPVTQRRFRGPTPTRTELVDATVNLPDVKPPNVKIAPEQLPSGLWTATAGSNEVATEPVYMQFTRFGVNAADNATERNTLRLAFGTEFIFNSSNWRLATGAAKQNRWLTTDAESIYSLQILNRKTRESRVVPFSSMTRGAGGQDIADSNYTVHLPEWGDFMRSMPHIQDSNEVETFRQYGAQTILIENVQQTSTVTEPLTLYKGKLHSVATKRGEGGYALIITFSSPFAKYDNSSSINLTTDDQKARDPGDTSLDWSSEMRSIRWGSRRTVEK